MSDTVPPADPTVPVDKAQFWADTIAAFTTSGQSVRAFCLSRGLEEKRFYTWRRNLGLSPVARPTPAPDAPARPFVPVRLVSDPVAEVVLPSGVTLRVPVSSDRHPRRPGRGRGRDLARVPSRGRGHHP